MSTPLPPPPARPAERRYEIGAPLGHGGSGEVFRAWDTRLQRHVALKRLSPPEVDDGPGGYRETVREATHLAAAQHPNIVTVYDLSEDQDGWFMTMELVEGETLEAVVRRGAFPLEDFLLLARQALAGLAAAHDAGLLHCDLKPANIMLTGGDPRPLQVKLLDFGIASFASEADPPAAPRLGENGEVTVLGTVEFMAPEQFEQARMTPQADLYSLGCIFYYTLAGSDPFPGRTISDIMKNHLEHRVTPLAELRPDLPPALCDWVMRLICRVPAQRPATAVQALAELKEAVDERLS
jgi:serine/threonine protein kinase